MIDSQTEKCSKLVAAYFFWKLIILRDRNEKNIICIDICSSCV